MKEYLVTLPTKPKRTHRSSSRSRRHRTQPKEATTTTTSSHPSQPSPSRSGSPTVHHRRVNREPVEEAVVPPGRVANCFAVPLCHHFCLVDVSKGTHMPSSPESPSRRRYVVYDIVCACICMCCKHVCCVWGGEAVYVCYLSPFLLFM